MKADPGIYAVATFHSTYSVLKTEKILKASGFLEVRLVPVPSDVSSDCGVTVRFRASDLPKIRPLLGPVEKDLEGFFISTADGWAPAPEEGP